MNRSTEEIWETFSNPLRSYIAKRVSDPQDVDDLLQNVFVKIHSRLETVKAEDRLVPWLYQITRRTVVDHYREQRMEVELQESTAADPNTDEDQDDAQRQLAGGLQGMIGCLPEKYQEALILTEINGLKQQGLAEQLGISLSGAKSRVQRGRELLRQMLLDCCHFEFDRRKHVIEYMPRPDCCPSCQFQGQRINP